ncbi:MAG: type III polyketide synthase [Candidatus Xenobia bacterium]
MILGGVGCALPPHRYEQDVLTNAAQTLWGEKHFNGDRLAQLHRAVLVGGRNLALPLEAYPKLASFGEANREFLRVGADIGEQAIRQVLDQEGLKPTDIDFIVFATVTGLSAPSLDALLANRLRTRPDLKRVPIFGLGCAAGAAGVARLYDYLRAWPEHVGLLVCVELCSLTLQKQDLSMANLIASGLFGDGAAACIGYGAARAPRPGPRIVATRSCFYPDTEQVMGWDIGEYGFRLVLSASVPDVVRQHLGNNVRAFLADHGLTRDDVTTWVCHPGGPKILQAMQEALSLSDMDVALTWRSLKEIGNLSSASVLFVLHETLKTPGPPGSWGLLMAMGPGFHSELVLFRW